MALLLLVSGNMVCGQNIEKNSTHVHRLLEQSIVAFEKNQFAEAITYLDECIKRKPYLAEAYKYRAMARANLNNLDGALLDYQILLHLEPENSEALFNRAVVRYRLGHYAMAAEDFEQLQRQPAGITNVLYFKTSPDLDGIVDIGALNNMQVEICSYLGLCYADMGLHDKALDTYSQAIAKYPMQTDLLINRALLYEKIDKKNAAVEDYAKVLAIEPENEKATINLNKLGVQIDKKDKIKSYDQLLEKNPDQIEALVQRAALYYNQGDYTTAIRDYSQILQLKEYNDDYWLSRGMAYLRIRNFEKAMADINQAIKINPENEKAWFNRGNIWHQQRQFSKAINDYSQAIFYRHDYAMAYYNRGMSQLSLKQKQQACLDLQEALNLGIIDAKKILAKQCLNELN